VKWLVSLLFVASVALGDNALEQAQSILKNTEIVKAKKLPSGIIAAYLSNGNIAYVIPSANLIFFGQFLDAATGENLSAKEVLAWREELGAKEASAQIDETDIAAALKIGASLRGSYKDKPKLIMFADPYCGYCQAALEWLKDKPVEVVTIYAPLSARSRGKAIEELKAVAQKNPEDKLAQMIEFAAKHNIRGTPTFWILELQGASLVVGFGDAAKEKIKRFINASSNK
jgi:protein-disulfide isomerase